MKLTHYQRVHLRQLLEQRQQYERLGEDPNDAGSYLSYRVARDMQTAGLIEPLPQPPHMPDTYRITPHGMGVLSDRSRKLSREDVEQIKAEYATGNVTFGALAARFDVSSSMISYIINGRRR